MQALKRNWFPNTRGDLLVGLVVALVLVPEAITFSIVAGVDPKIGLYASSSMAVMIAFAGGRPGMTFAAVDVMAPLMINPARDHGLQHLLVVTLLCGVLQVPAGYLRLGSLMCFVSCSVATGFVNALAILTFVAQLPELTDVGWSVYAMTAAGLTIVYGFPHLPRIGRLLPSSLVRIPVLTDISIYLGLDIRVVGDMGRLSNSLPLFLWPDVPLNLDALLVVLPYFAAPTAVGLLESPMIATIVDGMTDTGSDKSRECRSQGPANIATGLFGGMVDYTVIGQSVVNIKPDGHSRLSILVANIALLLMMVFPSDWAGQIPMAVLVVMMIMMSIDTSRWESICNLKRYPLSINLVMLVTVGVALTTHNLAFGAIAGVFLASLFSANKIGHYLDIDSERSADGACHHCQASGQVLFTSFGRFVAVFGLKEMLEHIFTDLRHIHLWSVTTATALDKMVLGFRQRGAQIDVLDLNAASATLIDHFGAYDESDAVDILPDH